MPQNMQKNVRLAVLGIHKQFDLILHNGKKEYICTPGETIGPLIREFYVIKYCTAGRGQIIFDSTTFPIKAGQCFVGMPGQIMTEVADEEDPWRHVWVTISGLRVGMLFKSMGITAKRPIFPWSENQVVLSQMHNAVDVCTDISEASELRRAAHAYLLFDSLLTVMQRDHPESSPENQTDEYIKKAMYYMEMNYSEPIKVSDVAAHIGLNRSYFFSIFKEQVHLSPQEYLTRLRMRKACELFTFPDATVTSVANALNYEPSVFFRHFKRIIGQSPSEYKRRIITEVERKDI